ncbi:hypothetical protein WAI453_000782 [Rhynchosporium graminicola]
MMPHPSLPDNINTTLGTEAPVALIREPHIPLLTSSTSHAKYAIRIFGRQLVDIVVSKRALKSVTLIHSNTQYASPRYALIPYFVQVSKETPL